MLRGLRDLSLVLGSRVAILLLTIGNQSCLAWFLGPAERGSFAVCIVYATVLSLIFTFGCPLSSLYFIASKKYSLSDGVANMLLYGGTGCLLAVAVGRSLLATSWPFFQKAPHSSFELALLATVTLFFETMFLRLIPAIGDFVGHTVLSLGNATLLVTLTFVGTKMLGWGVNGALGAVILTGGVTIVTILWYMKRRHGLRRGHASLEQLGPMLHYGLRSYAGNVTNQMNLQVGTVLLAIFASKEEIGFFAVAVQLAARVFIIPDALSMVLLQRVAIDRQGRKDLVAQCSRLVFQVCGVLLFLVIVCATPFVRIVLSPAFLPAVPLVRILAIGVLVRCVSKALTPYLTQTNHPGIVSAGVAVGTVCNFVLLWLLFPILRLPGAAWAMTLGFLISSAILASAFSRASGIPHGELWRYKRSDWAGLMAQMRRLWAAS